MAAAAGHRTAASDRSEVHATTATAERASARPVPARTPGGLHGAAIALQRSAGNASVVAALARRTERPAVQRDAVSPTPAPAPAPTPAPAAGAAGASSLAPPVAFDDAVSRARRHLLTAGAGVRQQLEQQLGSQSSALEPLLTPLADRVRAAGSNAVVPKVREGRRLLELQVLNGQNGYEARIAGVAAARAAGRPAAEQRVVAATADAARRAQRDHFARVRERSSTRARIDEEVLQRPFAAGARDLMALAGPLYAAVAALPAPLAASVERAVHGEARSLEHGARAIRLRLASLPEEARAAEDARAAAAVTRWAAAVVRHVERVALQQAARALDPPLDRLGGRVAELEGRAPSSMDDGFPYRYAVDSLRPTWDAVRAQEEAFLDRLDSAIAAARRHADLGSEVTGALDELLRQPAFWVNLGVTAAVVASFGTLGPVAAAAAGALAGAAGAFTGGLAATAAHNLSHPGGAPRDYLTQELLVSTLFGTLAGGIGAGIGAGTGALGRAAGGGRSAAFAVAALDVGAQTTASAGLGMAQNEVGGRPTTDGVALGAGVTALVGALGHRAQQRRPAGSPEPPTGRTDAPAAPVEAQPGSAPLATTEPVPPRAATTGEHDLGSAATDLQPAFVGPSPSPGPPAAAPPRPVPAPTPAPAPTPGTRAPARRVEMTAIDPATATGPAPAGFEARPGPLEVLVPVAPDVPTTGRRPQAELVAEAPQHVRRFLAYTAERGLPYHLVAGDLVARDGHVYRVPAPPEAPPAAPTEHRSAAEAPPSAP